MSIENTLKERSRYGSFDTHATLSQKLKRTMRIHSAEDDLPWTNLAPDMKEALEMIQHKIARILNGDPNYVDNWHDIQGYAKLIEDRLNTVQEPVHSPSTPTTLGPFAPTVEQRCLRDLHGENSVTGIACACPKCTSR